MPKGLRGRWKGDRRGGSGFVKEEKRVGGAFVYKADHSERGGKEKARGGGGVRRD